MSNTNKKTYVTTLALGAVFTAIVIVLQLLGAFIRFGPFSISLVLVPIVIGSALCGWKVGGWLGIVFGVAVLLSGDASAFFTVNPLGTVATVLVKGLLCGLAAALVFKALEKTNIYLAVMCAAVVCPVVNTGVFLLGCKLFFMEAVTEWALGLGFENAAAYMFLGLAGGNFIFELAINIFLAPIIVRVLNLGRKV